MSLISGDVLTIIVVPGLALASQFKSLVKEMGLPLFEVSANGTTDVEAVVQFGATNGIIISTYKSLHVVADAMKIVSLTTTTTIHAFFDEAHHIQEEKAEAHVYAISDCYASRSLFFTATPNDKLLEYVNFENIFRYTLLEAIEDNVCNNWDLCCMMADQNHKNRDVARAIVRAFHETNNGRILTKHGLAIGEVRSDGGRTRALDFLSEDIMRAAWLEEFPGLDQPIITVKCITGQTRGPERDAILCELQSAPDGQIYIVPFCSTMAEGVDTKDVNMVVVVDPITSPCVIAQFFGRVQRNPRMGTPAIRNGTILMMTFLDKDQCDDDESLVEHLRDRVSEPVAHTVAALKTQGIPIEDQLALMTLRSKPKISPETKPESTPESTPKTSESNASSSEDYSAAAMDLDLPLTRRQPTITIDGSLLYGLGGEINYEAEVQTIAVQITMDLENKVSPKTKMDLLKTYATEHKKAPKRSDPILGSFWASVTNATTPCHVDLFETAYKDCAELKKVYDDVMAKRAASYTPAQNMGLLKTYVTEHKKAPRSHSILGSFWKNITHATKPLHADLFEAARDDCAELNKVYNDVMARRKTLKEKASKKTSETTPGTVSVTSIISEPSTAGASVDDDDETDEDETDDEDVRVIFREKRPLGENNNTTNTPDDDEASPDSFTSIKHPKYGPSTASTAASTAASALTTTTHTHMGYDADRFSEEHILWKDAMAARFAEEAFARGVGPRNVAYFECEKLRTTTALLAKGFAASSLYVANPKASVCAALSSMGVNAFQMTFEAAASGPWSSLSFSCVYLDTCYASKHLVIGCIDSVVPRGPDLIAFTFTRRDSIGESILTREHAILDLLEDLGFRIPEKQRATHQYDDRGVSTSFVPRFLL